MARRVAPHRDGVPPGGVELPRRRQGLDLHARWTGWRRVHPFVSAYGEYLLGDDLMGRVYPDAYLVRGLAGVALPSPLSDTLVYVAADVGNRKGIRGLTEEATLGVGVRLALGAAPR